MVFDMAIPGDSFKVQVQVVPYKAEGETKAGGEDTSVPARPASSTKDFKRLLDRDKGKGSDKDGRTRSTGTEEHESSAGEVIGDGTAGVLAAVATPQSIYKVTSGGTKKKPVSSTKPTLEEPEPIVPQLPELDLVPHDAGFSVKKPISLPKPDADATHVADAVKDLTGKSDKPVAQVPGKQQHPSSDIPPSLIDTEKPAEDAPSPFAIKHPASTLGNKTIPHSQTTQENAQLGKELVEDAPELVQAQNLSSPSKTSTSEGTHVRKLPKSDVPHSQESQSPFALFSQGQAASRNTAVLDEHTFTEAPPDTSLSRNSLVSNAPVRKNKGSAVEDRPNLSAVSLADVPPIFATRVEAKESQGPLLSVNDINSIIDQIDKMYTASAKGQTDTVIVLKFPPLFEDAQVVIKSSDTAPKEFNLSFENLRQTAQQMIDNGANQANLRAALDNKGYTVHIITATTLLETNPIKTSASQESRTGDSGTDDGDREERRQGKKR